jgi:hypothetical protein
MVNAKICGTLIVWHRSPSSYIKDGNGGER